MLTLFQDIRLQSKNLTLGFASAPAAALGANKDGLGSLLVGLCHTISSCRQNELQREEELSGTIGPGVLESLFNCIVAC